MDQSNLFNLDDLVASEKRTAAQTAAEVPAATRNLREIVGTMLKLPHFTGELAAPETHEGLFGFFAKSHYLQIPHTAWSLTTIWERGYYLESLILLRNMLEVFAQLRYFQSRTQDLPDHLHPDKRGPRFKQIFEAIAPGYYEKYYGRLLSTLSHGKGAGPAWFRYDRSDPAAHRVRQGCEYDPDQMSLILNQLLPLLYGFISYFPVFFPNNFLSKNSDLEADSQDTLRWLSGAMSSHRSSFPQSHEWYDLIEKLVRR